MCKTQGDQVLYNLDVQETRARGICRIAHIPCHSLVSKPKLLCLIKPHTSWGLVCGPQNDNSGNWVELQFILTP